MPENPRETITKPQEPLAGSPVIPNVVDEAISKPLPTSSPAAPVTPRPPLNIVTPGAITGGKDASNRLDTLNNISGAKGGAKSGRR